MHVITITVDEIVHLNKIAVGHGDRKSDILNYDNIKNCSDLITFNVYGKELHIGLFRKASALMKCISESHGFVDGNKRTALLVINEFLDRNGWTFKPDKRTIEISLKTAREDISLRELEEWVRGCSIPKF